MTFYFPLSQQCENALVDECKSMIVVPITSDIFDRWLRTNYNVIPDWQAYGDYVAGLYFEVESEYMFFKLKWE